MHLITYTIDIAVNQLQCVGAWDIASYIEFPSSLLGGREVVSLHLVRWLIIVALGNTPGY